MCVWLVKVDIGCFPLSSRIYYIIYIYTYCKVFFDGVWLRFKRQLTIVTLSHNYGPWVFLEILG